MNALIVDVFFVQRAIGGSALSAVRFAVYGRYDIHGFLPVPFSDCQPGCPAVARGNLEIRTEAFPDILGAGLQTSLEGLAVLGRR